MRARPEHDGAVRWQSEQDLIRRLPVLVLNVHSHCNCRCVMCDIWKRKESTEIALADLERHRSALRRLGVRWVVLTGGEPLLHSDLAALCTFFREEKIRLTLLTTGLLLSKRAAMVAQSSSHLLRSASASRSPNQTSSAAMTPTMSSFDTFIGRPSAWCGEELRHAACTSFLSPRRSPEVCGPRRNLPPE